MWTRLYKKKFLTSNGCPRVTEMVNVTTALWRGTHSGKGFDQYFEKVNITSAKDGVCVAEVKVEESMTNIYGTIHGGYVASLVDILTTKALKTTTINNSGVSVNLNVNYISKAVIGEVVVIESKTVKFGRNLAFLEAILKNKSTNRIIATASHTKFVGQGAAPENK